MATGRLPDPNSSPLTAKGDLYTYSTVPAKLAVGNNGDTLVADSSATTGLRWQGDWNTGKNKIINGDFFINQRNFSSTTTSGTFGFDRFPFVGLDGTTTYSAQTFTPGTAPAAPYEARNFARIQSASQTAAGAASILVHRIEDVRTLANQTATLSFWAKANSGTPKVAFEFEQAFGSGGSPSAAVGTYVGQATLSTTWTRYSFTFSVPSISGKTIGTDANSSYTVINLWTSAGTTFNSRTGSLGIQSTTIDFWGLQFESGSVATPFTTATGTLAGELAAASRYYQRFTASASYSPIFPSGYVDTSTSVVNQAFFPVRMRTKPSSVEYANARIVDSAGSTYNISAIALTANVTEHIAEIQSTITGGTGGRYCYIQANNNAGAYVGFSAEL